MDSCPKELLAYDRAHKEKLIENDKMMHLWIGNYGVSALTVAIDHCMHGNKATSVYIKHAILSDLKENNEKNESQEIVAVYEMKQRTKILEQMGLPQSPK